MIISAISDLHGYKPELPGGDLLIIAGDLTARDEPDQYSKFQEWLEKQNYKRKIIIAGNHDGEIEKGLDFDFPDLGIEYLEDSGTEFQGLKIWGSPWTTRFKGMNLNCMAYIVDSDVELEYKWELIPDDIDILITHSPPLDFFDITSKGERVGSYSLRKHVMRRIKPKLHVFGHIHECGGLYIDCMTTKFVNSSIMNEYYEPVNKPVRIEI